MLRCLVLYLAAALASGFDEENPPLPVFSNRFTMRFEKMDYENLFSLPNNTVWPTDSSSSGSRTPLENFMAPLVISPANKVRHALPLTAFPTTTQTNEVKPSCIYLVGNEANPILPLTCLPLIRRGFEFIGKERVHDQDAYIWSAVVGLFGINIYFESAVAYTGEANEKNEPLAIPLRERRRCTDDKGGVILEDYILDFYDYQSLDKIDPDIWNIHEGITCKKHNNTEISLPLKFGHGELFYQLMNLLGNHEDQNTKQMPKNFLKYIERRIGHEFELPDSIQSSTAMYEGPPSEPDNALPFPFSESEIEEMIPDLPEQLDWRLHGAVTPVKDGMDDFCVASWAFSATGAIEGYHYLKTGMKQIIWMSEQVLIDCSWGFGNNGVYGGRPEHAFEWVKKYGMPSGVQYRSFNILPNTCNLTDVTVSTNITGYTRVPRSEKALKVALHTYGPVSAEVQAGVRFMAYRGGIYKRKCYPKQTVFVLIVGYGVLDGEQYWIIKGSFGTDWGDNGYMYLAVEDNLCGIQNSAYYVQ